MAFEKLIFKQWYDPEHDRWMCSATFPSDNYVAYMSGDTESLSTHGPTIFDALANVLDLLNARSQTA